MFLSLLVLLCCVVKSGRSVNLTTLYLGRLSGYNQYFVYILSPVFGRRNESMWIDRVSNPGSLALGSDALLVLRVGYGIWLYQFLIIAYRFSLNFKPIFEVS